MPLISMFPCSTGGGRYEWAKISYSGPSTMVRNFPTFISNYNENLYPCSITPYTSNEPILIGSCISVSLNMKDSFLIEGNVENVGTVQDSNGDNWVLYLVNGDVTVTYLGPS